MKLIDIIAVLIGVVLAGSLIAFSALYLKSISGAPSYVSPAPPAATPYMESLMRLLAMLQKMGNVSTLARYNVSQLIDMVLANPIVQENPMLKKALDIVNETYYILRASYNDYEAAQAYLQAGSYGLAFYYANDSYALATKAIDLMRDLEAMIPQLGTLLGPQGVNESLTLIKRGIVVAEGLIALDQLIMNQASHNLTTWIPKNQTSRIPGNLSVTLEAPHSVVLGEMINVTGVVLVNGTKPASMAVIIVGIQGGTSLEVESDSRGVFHVSLETVFNASGQECLYASPMPIASYAGYSSSSTILCIRLLYNATALTLNRTNITSHPGQTIVLSGKYTAPRSCRPSGVSICMGGACTEVPLDNNTFVYSLIAPSSIGIYHITVSTPQNGSCAPASAVSTLNVTPYPSTLIIWAPKVWVGWLPLPVWGTVKGPSSTSPWDKVVLMTYAGNYTTFAGAQGEFETYVATPPWGHLDLVVVAYPSNISLSTSTAKLKVYLLPGPPLFVATLFLGGVVWGLRRRHKERALRDATIGETTTNATMVEDYDLAMAWSALERAAGLSHAESIFLTARELASLSGKGDRAYRLALLIERAAYGPGLSVDDRGELRRLAFEVGSS